MKYALPLTLTLLGLACDFNPVVRQPKPEQLTHERVQVLGTLDARGEYALVAYEDDEGAAAQAAITRWRRNERCDVPVIGQPLAAPLPRARGAKTETPVLYVPIAVEQDEANLLMLVDEQCNAYGPFGAIDPGTAATVISATDLGGFLLYRDPDGRLSVLDPRRGLEPRALANEVTATRSTRELHGQQRDAVWLIAAGELRLMTLDGSTLHTLGSDVQTMSIARDGTRIAFVDAEDLYEAAEPSFKPNLLAEHGCKPRYGNGTLEFFAPCADQTLRRVNLASGAYQEFEDGVFASSTQEGVQLDYTKGDEDSTVLTAEFAQGKRITIEPTFDAQHVYVIDDQRIAGLVDGDQFGFWQRQGESYLPAIEHVADIVPHHRGKKHTFAWLVYHDVADALGTLTLLDQDGTTSEIARGVPLPSQQGFLVENGSALAQYPFSTPLVVLLEDARVVEESVSLAGQAEKAGERFCGRLKALSIAGTPRANLAEDVCSYAIVAAPVPGVLYSVADGDEQGLWFVAL
jgi:hypothetical protein